MRAWRRAILGAAVAMAVWMVPHDLRRVADGVDVARAADGWRAEFEAICAKTQDAMMLSTDELKDLVARCDKLVPEIEKLDESQRKVFTRRLTACRNLYAFVLETREK